MRRFLILVFVAGLVADARAQSSSFEIVVGERFGPIRETTSRADLNRLFGARRVIDQPVGIGEGFCTPGTIVFANSQNEIQIAWQDEGRTRVAFVVTSKAGSAWRTRRGVHIGSRLSELEKISGHALTFLGFGWDYGGGMEWTEDGKSLRLEISPDEDTMTADIMATSDIFGDREVRSDHPVIRRMKISVTRVNQNWGQHFAEADCP